MAYLDAYNNMPRPPGLGGFGGPGGGQPPFVPQMPGGFQPPAINGPVGMGGMGGGGPQMGGGGGGGGMFGFWDELGGLEKAYLISSGLGGLGNWWERRQDRKEDTRRYDEQTALDRQHRRRMGASWQAAYGS